MPPKIPVNTSKNSQARSRHRHATKKQLSPEERSRRLYKSLIAQIDGGHFKNALKTCDKILRVDATDEDALRAKLFLLLQAEQYDTALGLLQALGTEQSHEFEKAYALYRLRKEPEAKEVLSHMKGSRPAGVNDRGIQHLEAQLAYRQCAYQGAFDIYSQLLDSSSADPEEHADLITNMNAAQAHLDFLSTGYLQALDALPSSVINSLETAPPPAPPGGSVPIPSVAILPPEASVGSGRPEKKVRMSRVPKGVVPGVTPPPDPERWLKKSERSTFGQGSGRRRRVGGGATQGSTVEAPKSGGGVKQQKKRK